MPPVQCNSVDINLPTPPAPLTQPHLNTGSGSSSSMDTGSVDPGLNLDPGVASTPCISTQQVTPCLVTPVSRVNASEASLLHNSSPMQLGPMIASITCNPTPGATPVISANTPVLHCFSVTSGQVTPVTRGNTPEVSSLQISKATAASHSSLSANTQANINEGNNSLKKNGLHTTSCYLLHSTSCKYLIKYRPWFSSSITFPPFSPTSGTYSPSLGQQLLASSPT